MMATSRLSSSQLAKRVRAILRSWEKNSELVPTVRNLMVPMRQMLADSGFSVSRLDAVGTSYAETASNLVVWGGQHFEHPECSVPLSLHMDLVVSHHPDKLGHSHLELLLCDSGAREGVLANHSFQQSWVVSAGDTFESAQAWEQHVRKALQQLTPEHLQPFYLLAMAHIENRTSA